MAPLGCLTQTHIWPSVPTPGKKTLPRLQTCWSKRIHTMFTLNNNRHYIWPSHPTPGKKTLQRRQTRWSKRMHTMFTLNNNRYRRSLVPFWNNYPGIMKLWSMAHKTGKIYENPLQFYSLSTAISLVELNCGTWIYEQIFVPCKLCWKIC